MAISEVAKDLEAFGMSAEDAALAAGEEKPSIFPVYLENEPTVAMFLRCSTQWQQSDVGPTGLRYESVLALMDVYGVQDKRGMLEDLRVMERAALASARARH